MCGIGVGEGTGSSGSDLIISAGIPSSDAGQRNDKTMSIESGGWLPEGSLNNAPYNTSNTVHNKSPKDAIGQVACHENFPVEDKSAANPADHVSDTCDLAKDIPTHKKTSHDCIMLNHDEQPIHLDGQLNNHCVTDEERQGPKGRCVSGEASSYNQ